MNSIVEGLRSALRHWVDLAKVSPEDKKTQIAIAGASWLVPDTAEQYTIRDFSAAVASDIALMKDVRYLIWRIPVDHALFEKNPATYYVGIETPGEWLFDQLEASQSDPYWDRVHGIWLQRTHKQRLATLIDLASRRDNIQCAPSSTDPLMRTAAWMIVEDESHSIESVIAATNVTLHSFRDQYNVGGVLNSPHPIQNAIYATLSRPHRDPQLAIMPEAEAKAILAKYPHACVRMLQFMDANRPVIAVPKGKYGFSKQVDAKASSDAAISDLISWLPSRAATIGTMQMMGHSYQQVFDHLLDEGALELESFSLPSDMETSASR